VLEVVAELILGGQGIIPGDVAIILLVHLRREREKERERRRQSESESEKESINSNLGLNEYQVLRLEYFPPCCLDGLHDLKEEKATKT
jgi:hypothetical protein